MTNKFISMMDGFHQGIASCFGTRLLRFDSVSIVSRQSLLPILLLCLTLFVGVGQMWGANDAITSSSNWWVEILIAIIGLFAGVTIHHIVISLKQKNIIKGDHNTQQIYNGNTYNNYYGENSEKANESKESQQTSKQESSPIEVEKFDFYNCAKIGIAILYAAYLSNKNNKAFPYFLGGNQYYTHGFLTAMEINHPDKIRVQMASADDSFVMVPLYDSTFFSGIEEAAQMAKRSAVKPIIDQIELFFS